MSKALKTIREILIYAVIVFIGFWTFSWSTHTIVWFIGAFLALGVAVLVAIFKLMHDTIKMV